MFGSFMFKRPPEAAISVTGVVEKGDNQPSEE